MSLPLWVKIWLVALNAAFLLSSVVLPWEAARIVLIAYVASGPLLGAFAVFEGGLTRAMGLAHLVPPRAGVDSLTPSVQSRNGP